jgi:hypothetical protein
MSIANQLNLGLFVARLIHLSVKISALSAPMPVDGFLCKSFHYLLISSSRFVYWLSTWIAIERLYMTVVIRGGRLNNPRTVRQLIGIILMLVMGSGIYEARFMEFLPAQAPGSASMCIMRFSTNTRRLWTRIHLCVSIMHTAVPLLINMGCTMAISILVVQKKIKTMSFDRSTDRRVDSFRNRTRVIVETLKQNKEYVIGPAITLVPQLFLLPELIFSMLLKCQNLDGNNLRYVLMAAIWTTFLPQSISFWLYIAPSSFLSKHWQQTRVRK